MVQSRPQRLKKFVQLYSWGEDGVAWRVLDANRDVTNRKGQGDDSLRKESNECMAWLVSTDRTLTLLLSLQSLHQVVFKSFLF